MTERCPDHQDCIVRIHSLEKAGCLSVERYRETKERMKEVETTAKKEVRIVDERVDKVISRLNVTLGGVVVACIMLAVNLVIDR